MAERFASSLEGQDGVHVMHQELNQLVVRFTAAGRRDDEHTRRVIEAVQGDGTCFPSATVWHGFAAMRVSVSNWRTDEADVDRSVNAILAAHGAA